MRLHSERLRGTLVGDVKIKSITSNEGTCVMLIFSAQNREVTTIKCVHKALSLQQRGGREDCVCVCVYMNKCM